jgi:hypothetical protein
LSSSSLAAPAARIVVAFSATVCLSLLAAGCGSPGSHVAQLGSISTHASTPQGGVVAFSRCMRLHGVSAYPDPGSDGLIPKKTPQEVGVSASAFQAAQRACIHLVPNRGGPTPAQVQEYRNAMLIYARCIRAHGVANMPDPDNRGHLDIGPGTGVDLNTPRFQAAFQACKSRLLP